MQHVGREISNEFAIGVFERSPPTLILVPAFIQKETKMETNKDSTGLNHQGVYILLKCLNLFYFYLYIFYFIVVIIIYFSCQTMYDG